MRWLIAFLKLQVSASAFGIAILTLIMVTAAVWQEDWLVARYDFLFLLVLAMQALLLATGMETWSEARVIFVFHAVGVLMEIFKTSVGSWVYPEPAFFRIWGVPLFTGFMYSAVGSYLARGWRLTGMRLSGAPPEWLGGVLALLIYINFYSHHFLPDIRMALFVAIGVLYWRCWGTFARVVHGSAPLLALFGFAALMVYAAENIGSLSGTWLYPNQHAEWRPVHIGKLGSWFLLMIVSFSLVRLVRSDDAGDKLGD